MLLYSTLHLAGARPSTITAKSSTNFSVSIDEIKRFRQIDSRTPGHPESHLTTGVETTTGPLGQGAGNSVAWPWPENGSLQISIARSRFSITTSSPSAATVDMMEGVCCEAASCRTSQARQSLLD